MQKNPIICPKFVSWQLLWGLQAFCLLGELGFCRCTCSLHADSFPFSSWSVSLFLTSSFPWSSLSPPLKMGSGVGVVVGDWFTGQLLVPFITKPQPWQSGKFSNNSESVPNSWKVFLVSRKLFLMVKSCIFLQKSSFWRRWHFSILMELCLGMTLFSRLGPCSYVGPWIWVDLKLCSYKPSPGTLISRSAIFNLFFFFHLMTYIN